MQFTKPIVFLDIESTGTNTTDDRIIELSICKIENFCADNETRQTKTKRYNPGIHIPASSTKVHGIKDEDVKDLPAFKRESISLLAWIQDCDFGGFNSNHFDLPLLFNEFSRAGLYWDYSKANFFDAATIYKIKEPRTLAAAYKHYVGNNLENAHNAQSDIMATIEIFKTQLTQYPDIRTTPEELNMFCNYNKQRLDMAGKFVMDTDGKTILVNFGKNKGKPAKDDYGFLTWMYYKATFPEDTKNIVKQLMQENFTAHIPL